MKQKVKVVTWLLIAVPVTYFVILGAIIVQHYITVGSVSGNTWFFGSRILIGSTTAGVLSILVGFGLVRANK
ncbi:hypothetical protein GCM10007392_03380 [Saccharospirillum salsuginis]|uniref:Uncharacterized protein n=1 Tax=Saccharospirillum salsuginis TaxID=418750 RepID=A0A918K2P0_9GAMM|nr:hypothetical protein GCM10007392_03380 [Saccharospirillum salsuginis]